MLSSYWVSYPTVWECRVRQEPFRKEQVGGRLVKGMFHRAIISGMAVSPEDLAAGALALQVFVKNAKNVEIIVQVAFAVIPTVLGLGAAGLLGSGIINTAKEVRNSISLLKTVGPGLQAGIALNTLRKETGKRWIESGNRLKMGGAFVLAPIQSGIFLWKKRKQDTQGKQEEQGSGGGGGGSPPPPPEIKASDKKEERPKPTGIDTYSPIDELNPFKKKK